MTTVELPRPLEHQVAPLLDDARFKLWNWGRRAGKSRGSLTAAAGGHGPGSTWGPGHDPLYKGVFQGVDVIWVAKEYPQALTIWQEEVMPRFAGRDGITINQQTRQVRVEATGAMLEIRSAEAIDGIRGRGGRLGGIILDEAAHWDLAYAWRSVLLPALLDHNGWAIFNSSPNAGHDGNPERRVPSQFNIIAQEIIDGTRPDWSYTHLTAADNPVITAEALAALVAEYPPESPQLQEEVYAKLLVSGAGLAFPEWNAKVHLAPTLGPVSQYRWTAAMDWGYRSPGCFLLAANGIDSEIVVRYEHYFREQTAREVGRQIGQTLNRRSDLAIPEWIAGDEAMWGVTGGGLSIAADVQQGLVDVLQTRAPALIPAPKGPGSRVAGWNLVHEALRYDPANLTADGTLAPFHRPRLRVHPDCTNLIRTLPALPRDDKNSEDVNTDAEDHAADALRYLLVLGQPHVEKAPPGRKHDQHPGWHRDGTPRRPHLFGYDEAHERDLAATDGRRFQTGMRWTDE